jgi:hypothetical protein
MAAAPAEFLARDARAGFPHFPGMRLSGSIPVAQDVLNHVLSQIEQIPKGLRVDIDGGNRVVVRFGVVQAAATLHSPAALDGRTITLELASSIVAWTVSQSLRAPFVSIRGRVITIDLARIPAVAPWQAVLARLERIVFSTQPGLLNVGFEWRVPTAVNDGARAG